MPFKSSSQIPPTLAEWARVNDKFTEAECLYEEAIECAAKESSSTKLQLPANSSADFILKKRGYCMPSLFLESAFYYEKWGAQNKVEQLKEEFEELLQEKEGEQLRASKFDGID